MSVDPPSAASSPLEAFVDVLAQRVADQVLARLAERDARRSAAPDASALRMDEAGRRLGLSEREVQRQVLKGTLKSVKVGRVRLIPLSALDQFLEAQRAS
jgi:excisionase family DNA binding protein